VVVRDPVTVLIFDRPSMFETAFLMSVFGTDYSNSGVPKFRLLVVAGEDGPLRPTGGQGLRIADASRYAHTYPRPYQRASRIHHHMC
jgi:hypothetical protein